MGLSKKQQKIIKAYGGQLSPGEIAEELKVSEREVAKYLKKKIRPDKLKKIISKFAPEMPADHFSFKKFFKENYWYFALLAFLVFAVYANSLNNALVSDDIGAITANPEIGQLSSVFSSFSGITQKLIYYTVYSFSGTNPTYYRLTNILLHIATVFLIFLILSLLYNKKLGLMTAALFAVHPMLSESVAWISGHPYILNSFFFLLSFFLYLLKNKSKLFYYSSIFAFILSLSSSERGFVLCAVFLLFEWLSGNLRDNWKKIIPFFAASLAVAAMVLTKVGYRVSVLQSDFYLTPGTDSLLVKIPTSVASYFGLIFWPDKLSLYHTEMVFTTLEYWITVLVFLAYLGIIVFAYLKNHKAISFWLIFFLIPLAPTLSPLRIAWAVAERYAYLSALGIIFAAAWVIYKISEKEKFRMATYLIFWIIVGMLSIRTIIRNTDWKSEESLWFATVKTSPSGPNIHNNLGAIYQGKGENDKAIEEFQLAIKINPQYADAYHNLGNTYYSMGKYDEAETSYQGALKLNLRLWQSHQNLAAIHYAKGNFNEAKKALEEAKKLNPAEASIQQNLDLVNQALQEGQNLAPVAPQ